MKTFFLFLLLIPLSLFSSDLVLRENIKEAQNGDYVVISHNKSIVLFHILDNQGDRVKVEEISVSKSQIDFKNISWIKWIEDGADGHNAWITYNIDLIDGKVEDCFSVSRQGWVDAIGYESFMPTLLGLSFKEVPDNERRRVGQQYGVDRRSLWQPRLIYNGVQVRDAKFDVWRATWPKDGSDLADKVIEIYLPQDKKYIGYFPHWLQISNAFGKVYLRVVDSGKF